MTVASPWVRLRHQLHQIFMWRKSELGVWHSVISALDIGLPALVGLLLHQTNLGFIGALCGLLFSVSDIEGKLAPRLRKLAQTAGAILIFGFAGTLIGLGSSLFWIVFLVLLLVVSTLQVSSNALAASLRLGIIAFVSVASLPAVSLALAQMLLFAAFVGAATRMAGARFYPNAPGVMPPSSAQKPLSVMQRARFCAFYALAGIAALVVGQTRGVSHPVWITVTVLLVMQPDAHQAFDRIVQRAFGTLIGVIAAAVTVSVFHSQWGLFAAVLVLAFVFPQGATRNYWLQSALTAWLILVLYDFASAPQFDSRLISERLMDVSIGCALALVATVGAFVPLPRALKRS